MKRSRKHAFSDRDGSDFFPLEANTARQDFLWSHAHQRPSRLTGRHLFLCLNFGSPLPIRYRSRLEVHNGDLAQGILASILLQDRVTDGDLSIPKTEYALLVRGRPIQIARQSRHGNRVCRERRKSFNTGFILDPRSLPGVDKRGG